MDNWDGLAYSRAKSRHDHQVFTQDVRLRPKRVSWAAHALVARAYERMGMSEEEVKEWFKTTEYLGRWANDEGWGDDRFVALGIRDRGRKGVMTIKTIIPRAYWDYDVEKYLKKLDEITG